MKQTPKPPKVQLQSRPTRRISVNDALTQRLFSMSADEYERALSGEESGYLEAENKKHGKVTSHYWLKVLDDERVKISAPLDEFDRDILDACISAQATGNPCVTVKGIWRGMTGKTTTDVKLTPSLRKEILERVDRLAVTRLTVDVSDACNKGLYPADMKFKIRASLLPCRIAEAELNGQLVDAVIHFDGESPILQIARARGKRAQILTYDTALLDVPNQRHTPTTIAITNYLLRRIEAAKAHTNLKRTICFPSLWKNCGLTGADKYQRREHRKTVETTLKSFVEAGLIEAFELVKERGEFSKITFKFSDETPKPSQKQRK